MHFSKITQCIRWGRSRWDGSITCRSLPKLGVEISYLQSSLLCKCEHFHMHQWILVFNTSIQQVKWSVKMYLDHYLYTLAGIPAGEIRGGSSDAFLLEFHEAGHWLLLCVPRLPRRSPEAEQGNGARGMAFTGRNMRLGTAQATNTMHIVGRHFLLWAKSISGQWQVKQLPWSNVEYNLH